MVRPPPTSKATRNTGTHIAKSIGKPRIENATHNTPVKIAPPGIGRLAIATGIIRPP